MTGTRVNDLANITLEVAEDLLRRFARMRFVAQGTSMLPAILPGDEVVVARASFQEVGVGQVVLFREEGRWFLHRVQKIVFSSSQAYLIAQGDSLPHPDPPVFPTQLLGRVIAVEREGQQRMEWARDSAGRAVVRAAIRHVPYFATALLLLYRTCSRSKNRDRFVASLARRKPGGAV